jgi:CRP/FNR family transcriptional regulator
LIQVKIKARPGAKKLSAMTPALPLKPLPPCVSGIGSDAGRGLAVCSCEGQCRIGLHCHTRKLNRHQHAFLENDTQTHVHWVKKGVMRLYKSLGNGRRQIVGFAFPGDFVGLGPDAKYLFSAQAVAATELRAVPKSEFEAIAREESRFSSKLFEAVSADLVRAYDLALTVGQRGSEAGLAAFLLEMHARTSEAESMDVLLQIPRTDIADYLGVTTETVSRTFSKLTKRGLIEMKGRRGIRLVNRAALEQLTEGLAGCSHVRFQC